MSVHQTLARIMVSVQEQVEEFLHAADLLDSMEHTVKKVSG